MSLQKLARLIGPPPLAPVSGSPRAWTEVESLAGTLPADYMEFARTYGAGCIAGFFWVFIPGAENENLDLLTQYERSKDTVDELRNDPNYGLPFKVGSMDGELFPVGCTDNGDLLFWQIQSKPKPWSIVVIEGRAAQWERFDLSLTDFLAGVLSGVVKCSIFPGDLAEQPPSFAQ